MQQRTLTLQFKEAHLCSKGHSPCGSRRRMQQRSLALRGTLEQQGTHTAGRVETVLPSTSLSLAEEQTARHGQAASSA